MIFPVFVLFTTCSILFIQSKRIHWRISITFFWMMLSLIAAFRSENMADISNYLLFWEGWIGDMYEPGFVLMATFIKKLTTNFHVFLFASAALSIGLKLFAICRISPLIWGSLLIYISNIFILHDMIQMRCAIASGLLLCALYYVKEKRLKPFLLISFVALLFHYSAIIIFPLWLLNKEKPQKVLFIGLIIGAYLIRTTFSLGQSVQYIPIKEIQDRWSLYSNSLDMEINIFNALQLSRVCLCIVLFWVVDKIYKKNDLAILLCKIYALSIAALVLLSDFPVLAFRISEFYQTIEIVLLPMLIYAFGIHRLLGRITVILIGLCFLLLNVFYNKLLL